MARFTEGDHSVSLEPKWSKERDISVNDTTARLRGGRRMCSLHRVHTGQGGHRGRLLSSKFHLYHSLAKCPWASHSTSLNFRFRTWSLFVHHWLPFLSEDLLLHASWGAQHCSQSHNTKTVQLQDMVNTFLLQLVCFLNPKGLGEYTPCVRIAMRIFFF